MRNWKRLGALLLVGILLLSLSACKKKDEDVPVDAQPSDSGESTGPTDPAALPGADGNELPVYDQQLIATYYDYFAQNGAMLNPVFAYPGESNEDDRRNLFVFGLQTALYGTSLQNSVPKAVFDSMLLLHFDTAIDTYDGSEGRIDGDQVVAGDFSVSGVNRFVLTELVKRQDGSKVGTFRIYHFAAGDSTDQKKLREGYIGAYEAQYSCTAVIRFSEMEDKESLSLRFHSIALSE